MKKIFKEEDINVDIETIFNLINDIENYPNYLPWCTDTEVIKQSETVIIGKIYISKKSYKMEFLY